MEESEDESRDSEPTGEEEAPRRRTTDSLVSELYEELRALARKKMAGEASGHTLSATALVNEAYLALARSDEPKWDNRGHFYVAAAQAMRRILIDRARARNAQRRGGGQRPAPLPEDSVLAPEAPERSDELIALDDALEKLGREDPRKQQLVTLRYFVGLTIDEAADVLEISRNTAKRDWRFARVWLQRELNESLGSGS